MSMPASYSVSEIACHYTITRRRRSGGLTAGWDKWIFFKDKLLEKMAIPHPYNRTACKWLDS
jgi:hypothetical protein